jgi:hypothetical protein
VGKHIRTRRVGVHSLIAFRLGAPNILPSTPITVYRTAFDFEMSEIFFSLTETPPSQNPKVKGSQKLLLLYEHISSHVQPNAFYY